LPLRPIRVAHAHGNRRSRIERAIEASVDYVETDLRFDRGRVWARHELRLLNLPLLYNVGTRGIHRQGPWATSLGRLFLRLDIAPLPLAEIIARASGEVGLMLDFKADRYNDRGARRFVERVFSELEYANYRGQVACCGNWRLLNFVHDHRPDVEVIYSIDRVADWNAVAPRLGPDGDVAAITIHKHVLDDERGAILRERGVRAYCWDVDDETEVHQAVARGACGIISGNLDMLADLAEVTHRAEAS
jgi:glycerophosphoryl diester phosphodiesterase